MNSSAAAILASLPQFANKGIPAPSAKPSNGKKPKLSKPAAPACNGQCPACCGGAPQ